MHPFLTNYTRKKIIVATGDPFFNNVTLLTHMNGTDGSTTFTDVKGHTITPVGNAQIDTAQSKFGGSSALFDGTGDCLLVADSSEWDLPGDFTIEFWARKGSIGIDAAILSTLNTAQTVATFSIGVYANTYVQFGTVISGSGYNTRYNMDAGIGNTNWHHIALVRSSGLIRFYVDGIGASTTFASTVTYIASTDGLFIGSNGSGSYDNFTGHIDDVRITKGIARYTTNFTIPTTAFPDS